MVESLSRTAVRLASASTGFSSSRLFNPSFRSAWMVPAIFHSIVIGSYAHKRLVVKFLKASMNIWFCAASGENATIHNRARAKRVFITGAIISKDKDISGEFAEDGYWMLDAGYLMLDIGYWILDEVLKI